MIEDAEQIGRSRCKDHFHPLFKITLKLPQTPEATVLASLLGPAVAAAETYPQAATPIRFQSNTLRSGIGSMDGLSHHNIQRADGHLEFRNRCKCNV
jgi:hypothetical protein